MRKTIFFVMFFLAWAQAVGADGVNGTLTDPHVVPIVRGPDPLAVPLVITETHNRYGSCHNSQHPGTPPVAAGYELRFACDHIVVGVGLLAGLYLLGSAAATN